MASIGLMRSSSRPGSGPRSGDGRIWRRGNDTRDDDVEAAAREVIGAIEDRIHLLTFRSDSSLLPRGLAAAGLARRLALTDAIDKLVHQGRGDVAGALARLVLEAHHIALYVLLAGHKAVESSRRIMLSMSARSPKRTTGTTRRSRNSTRSSRIGARRRSCTSRRCARSYKNCCAASGDNTDLMVWYTMLYRGESTFNVHGLGQINRYIDLTSDPWQLIRNPAPVSERGPLWVAVVLTGHLASWVFDRHGIGIETIDDAMAVLHAAIG